MEIYSCIENHNDDLLIASYNTDTRERTHKRVEFKPILFRSEPGADSEFRTLIDGIPLKPIVYPSISAARKAFKHGRSRNPLDQLHGYDNWCGQYICENYLPGDVMDRSLLKLLTFDIETQSDQGFPVVDNPVQKILTIAAATTMEQGCVYVFGTKEFDDCQYEGQQVFYHRLKTEEELLEHFIDLLWNVPENLYPDAVTGWNTKFFDIPYFVNRCKRLGLNVNRLSPWGLVKEKKVELYNRPHTCYRIYGVADIDSLDLFRKFGYAYLPQESYKLDSIANAVLGKGKVAYKKQFSTLAELYKRDYEKFVQYNVADVLRVNEIEEKLGMIDMALIIQYSAGIGNLANVLGTISVWDGIVYHELLDRGLVCPLKLNTYARNHSVEDDELKGAYIKEPQVGRHRWVVSFDVRSLYPSIMMQYNLSPETVRKDGHGNLLLTARSDRSGLVPDLIERIFDERVSIKREMNELKIDSDEYRKLDNRQQVMKIQINALYGAFANKHFRYYDNDIANKVTEMGQKTIMACEKSVNEVVNQINGTSNEDYIIAMDTDSLYISLERFIENYREKHDVGMDDTMKMIDSVSEEVIQPAIQVALQQVARENGVVNRLEMHREVVGEEAIWTAKKRYIVKMLAADQRYEQPRLKVVGLESVRSSTPGVCREKLKEAYMIILNNRKAEAIQKFIADFRKEFKTMSPEEVSAPRSVSGLEKYRDDENIYRKGTPQQVKSALIYNHHIVANKLERYYRKIMNGDKVKLVSLVPVNPTGVSIIAFPDDHFPHRLFDDQSYRYIDYDTMFEKSFIEPLMHILEVLGWEPVREATLFDLMAET